MDIFLWALSNAHNTSMYCSIKIFSFRFVLSHKFSETPTFDSNYFPFRCVLFDGNWSNTSTNTRIDQFFMWRKELKLEMNTEAKQARQRQIHKTYFYLFSRAARFYLQTTTRHLIGEGCWYRSHSNVQWGSSMDMEHFSVIELNRCLLTIKENSIQILCPSSQTR